MFLDPYLSFSLCCYFLLLSFSLSNKNKNRQMFTFYHEEPYIYSSPQLRPPFKHPKTEAKYCKQELTFRTDSVPDYSKYFSCITSFNPHYSPMMMWLLQYSLLLSRKLWHKEIEEIVRTTSRSSGTTRSSGTGIWTQAIWVSLVAQW